MALKWNFYHVSVFTLTFWGYALFHATRKTFSNVKQSMIDEWTPTEHNDTENVTLPDELWNSHHLFPDKKKAEYFLGVLDTVFMVAYAVGLYISGIIGDRFNMRKVLTIGMCSSAMCVFMFGCVSEWLHVYSIPYYVIFWIFNGLLQSTGWPAMVAVMANWFGRSSRGFIFGVWSACASVGNIVGALIVSQVLPYGYEYAFLVPACCLFAWGVLTFFALVPHPYEVGLPLPDEELTDLQNLENDPDREPLMSDEHDAEPDTTEARGSIQNGATEEQEEEHRTTVERADALSFWRALLLPGVILYSLSYACLKFVNYAFFFWLPFYLTSKFHWEPVVADEISIWYDVGGIVAGIIGGFLSDRIGQRAPIVVLMLALAMPSLYFYSVSPDNKLYNALLMANTGFWIGGPANLISSCISADLGRQGPVQGDKEALATVTGIVDGTGSIGAAIGQVLIPVIQLQLGWKWVFAFFLVMTFISILCLLPVLWAEIKASSCFRRCCGHSGIRGDSILEEDNQPVRT